MEIKISAIKAGVPTGSGRIYSQEALEKLNSQIIGRGAFVYLSSSEPTMETICAKFENSEVKDGQLVGTLRLADSPPGKLLSAFIEQGIGIGDCIFPSSIGEVDKDGNVIPDTLQLRSMNFIYSGDSGAVDFEKP